MRRKVSGPTIHWDRKGELVINYNWATSLKDSESSALMVLAAEDSNIAVSSTVPNSYPWRHKRSKSPCTSVLVPTNPDTIHLLYPFHHSVFSSWVEWVTCPPSPCSYLPPLASVRASPISCPTATAAPKRRYHRGTGQHGLREQRRVQWARQQH